MTSPPVLSPRRRRPSGCAPALAVLDLPAPVAVELAAVAKALGDPTRLRIVDAIREAAPEAVCQCELVPLFETSQAAVAKHLGVLVAVGVLASERRGTWTYYWEAPEALAPLAEWLGPR